MAYHHIMPGGEKPPNVVWQNSDHYYDYPDGEQLFKKIKVMFRDSSVLGFGLGTCYSYSVLSTQNHKLAIIRVLKFGIPFVCFGVTFPIAAHALVKLREKHDWGNYFGAGMASGAMWSVGWGHNFYTGLGRAVICGLIASFWYQERVVQGGKFVSDGFYNARADFGSPSFKRWLDWGITPHKQGNWTRDPPPEQTEAN